MTLKQVFGSSELWVMVALAVAQMAVEWGSLPQEQIAAYQAGGIVYVLGRIIGKVAKVFVEYLSHIKEINHE